MEEELVSVRVYKNERQEAKIAAAKEGVDIPDIIRGWRLEAVQRRKEKKLA